MSTMQVGTPPIGRGAMFLGALGLLVIAALSFRLHERMAELHGHGGRMMRLGVAMVDFVSWLIAALALAAVAVYVYSLFGYGDYVS